MWMSCIFIVSLLQCLRPGTSRHPTGSTHDTILRFSYSDDDKNGPKSWGTSKTVQEEDGDYVLLPSIEDKPYTKNHCVGKWTSPINIGSKTANVIEIVQSDDTGDNNGEEELPQTLTMVITAHGISELAWEFGHPRDTYHGIEVRSSNLGILQLMDKFDPLSGTDAFTPFDFKFLSIFYCDPRKAPAYRSMHQIDGQRFPLELQYVFFLRPFEYVGVDRNVFSEMSDKAGTNVAVIVVVHGEIGKEDNKYLQPVIEAAGDFQGKNFGVNDLDAFNAMEVPQPWSPTWLLPDPTSYYYYNGGSFPVPPCWRVARYYVMKDRFNFSQSQLDVLTNIKTERENTTGGKLPCTFSVLQNQLQGGDVIFNPLEYEMLGDDAKPRTLEEEEILRQKQRKRDTFRKRLAGQAVLETDDGMRHLLSRWIPLVTLLTIYYVLKP